MTKHSPSWLTGLGSISGLTLAALVTLLPGLSGQDIKQNGVGAITGGTLVRPSMEAGALVGKISVDGRLDEEAWARAEVASGFIQGSPVEGIPAEEDTELSVIIGDDALYIAARMHESDPSSIVRQLVRRDQEGQYDYISVSIDPNLDRRTGYYFRVNASNVQVDQYYYNDQRLDRAWNAVWESAVQLDERGWTAEIRIPLSQIRYESTDDPQTWGSNFARKRMSTNETSYFSLRSRVREGFVSQFGGTAYPDPLHNGLH